MEMLDKTTLRALLAVAGVVLLLGIYLWDRWKRRRRELNRTLETLDSALPEENFELEEIDAISIHPLEEGAPPDIDAAEVERLVEETEPQTKIPPPSALPELIQVSIAAPKNQPFRGPELIRAFADLDLQYGEMDIFHLYEGDEIRFSVATMVKPGTFPIDAMEGFQTPGLTLFLQPPMVPRPLDALERMITTCHALARRLGGRELDDRRRPLTAATLSHWRRQLRGED